MGMIGVKFLVFILKNVLKHAYSAHPKTISSINILHVWLKTVKQMASGRVESTIMMKP